MRRRYFSVPKQWYDWGHEAVEDSDCRATEFIPRSVFEKEDGPIFSGLLDKDGQRIMYEDSMEPIGFVRFGEEE